MKFIEYGDANAAHVLFQPVEEYDLAGMENEVDAIKRMTGKPFRLIAPVVAEWNKDLSPWNAPAVFGKEDFGCGAQATLNGILKLTEDGTKKYFIGGYSLAGLFALWAAFRTGAFAGAAAASPSVWFPGFAEFMNNNTVRCSSVYLSLGDKEEKTKNAVMATVGGNIRAAYALLRERGVDCALEWNAGGHFKDAELRTAKAFAWLLGREP